MSTESDLVIRGTILTDPGLGRAGNQDSVRFVTPRDRGRGVLALVADGMGGHAAGEIASSIAAAVVEREYYASAEAPLAALHAAILAANAEIYTRAQIEPDLQGMGTTGTALVIRNARAFIAHVGDSRAYLLHAGRLRQLSQDHSLVGDLLQSGAISEEQALRHPQRNVILRAIGTRSWVDVDLMEEPLAVGDVLLLCSDGLSDLVDDSVIAETLGSHTPDEACRLLVQAALVEGGVDNVSVGVFAIVEDQPAVGTMRTTRSIKLNEV